MVGLGNNKINISQSFVFMELNRKMGVMNGYLQVNRMQTRLKKRGKKSTHHQEPWEDGDMSPVWAHLSLSLS